MALNDDALTAQEVSEMLGIGKNAVYEMAKSGKIGSYRIGRKIRFTSADVTEYVRSARSKTTSAQEEKAFSAQPRQRDFIICGQDVILDVLSNYPPRRVWPLSAHMWEATMRSPRSIRMRCKSPLLICGTATRGSTTTPMSGGCCPASPRLSYT